MIADILHPIAADEFAEREGSGEYRPRPSIAGPERCLRQMVYWSLGEPRKPLSGRAVTVFDDSSWHEELTMDWIRKSAYKIHSQQMEVDCDFGLTGHIDGIITDVLGGDWLLEHKALSHFGWMGIWGGALPLDYITQTCLYYRGLLKVQPDLKGAILLVKNKNQSGYLEIKIEYDAETDTAMVETMTNHLGEVVAIDTELGNLCQSATERFWTVAEHVKANTFPPRQYKQAHWRCHYCGYGRTCWQGYDKEFEEAAPGEIEMDDVAAAQAANYLVYASGIKELKAKQDMCRERLLGHLAENRAHKATGEGMTVTVSAQKRQKLISDRIPPDVLKAAMEETFSDVIRVFRNKETNDE